MPGVRLPLQDAEIRIVPAAVTRPLRAELLRPGSAPEELVYPGDDDPETRHLGAYLHGKLVSIASVYQKAPPGEISSTTWQLRGMATRPEVQGQGHGRALLQACIAYATFCSGTLLWCNARTGAVGFYQASGFQARGEEFQIPGVGPHFVMWRSLRTTGQE